MFDYSFEKINRTKYNYQDGTDAEESINVYFKAIVKEDLYRQLRWKDHRVCIKLIEYDRYHDHPYFHGIYLEEPKEVWSHKYLSNYIEAVEYLQVDWDCHDGDDA